MKQQKLLSAALLLALPALVVGLEHSTQAAVIAEGRGAQLLIGLDDDNQDNETIKGGAAGNQFGRLRSQAAR